MIRKPITSKIDSGIPKSVAYVTERRASSLSRRSDQQSGNKRTSVGIGRPRSAGHRCEVTIPPPHRPWTSSVLVDRRSQTTEQDEPKIILHHKPGQLPSYLRKKKSSTCLKTPECAGLFQSLEDETPPPLVPSESPCAGSKLNRQSTFDSREESLRMTISAEIKQAVSGMREQVLDAVDLEPKIFQINEKTLLEDALKQAMEEKQTFEAENKWLREEFTSQQAIIHEERQRFEKLQNWVHEIPLEMERLCQEIEKRDLEIAKLNSCLEKQHWPEIEELQRSRNDLSNQVERLLEELQELRKENEALRGFPDCKEMAEEDSSNIEELRDYCLKNDQDYEAQKSLNEHLQRNLEKYRVARKKLKDTIQILTDDNHRLRSIIENRRNEGSFIEGDASKRQEQLVLDSINEEFLISTNCLEELRFQKKTRQRNIAVKKYQS